jgi:hypothetical protein
MIIMEIPNDDSLFLSDLFAKIIVITVMINSAKYINI